MTVQIYHKTENYNDTPIELSNSAWYVKAVNHLAKIKQMKQLFFYYQVFRSRIVSHQPSFLSQDQIATITSWQGKCWVR